MPTLLWGKPQDDTSEAQFPYLSNRDNKSNFSLAFQRRGYGPGPSIRSPRGWKGEQDEGGVGSGGGAGGRMRQSRVKHNKKWQFSDRELYNRLVSILGTQGYNCIGIRVSSRAFNLQVLMSSFLS